MEYGGFNVYLVVKTTYRIFLKNISKPQIFQNKYNNVKDYLLNLQKKLQYTKRVTLDINLQKVKFTFLVELSLLIIRLSLHPVVLHIF